MYSKEEAAKLKTAFWTAYGQYMSPIPSSEGEKINWINYRTGEKHIHFKTETDNRTITIAVVLNHPDFGLRSLHFEQFEKFKAILEEELQEEWIWKCNSDDADCRIYNVLEGLSIFNKEHWPQIISFLKQRMIGLDAFWNNVKYAFEELR